MTFLQNPPNLEPLAGDWGSRCAVDAREMRAALFKGAEERYSRRGGDRRGGAAPDDDAGPTDRRKSLQSTAAPYIRVKERLSPPGWYGRSSPTSGSAEYDPAFRLVPKRTRTSADLRIGLRALDWKRRETDQHPQISLMVCVSLSSAPEFLSTFYFLTGGDPR
jgi:hypothetical protein